MRRLIALFASLVLLTSLPGVASASVMPAKQFVAAPPAAASSNCDNMTTTNTWATVGSPLPSGWITTGARAQFYDVGRLWECTDTTGLDDVDGPSYWSAVTGSNTNEIVQIGVIKCHGAGSPSDSPCYGSRAGTPRLFYAWGRESNCTGTSHSPRPLDLGVQPTNGYHEYAVLWDKDAGRVRFYYDGTEKVNISDSTLCWLRGSAFGTYSTERWDGGDGAGDVNWPIVVRYAQTGYYGHGWNDPDFAFCYTTAPDLYCSVKSSSSAWLWTQQ